ncbi:MAG: tRNA lysidine(34) synthetase TilS [Rhodospirillales bacterium]|nr:tRNA lysidine(34) synthetase TilS [Rhodospirillales bacterium]
MRAPGSPVDAAAFAAAMAGLGPFEPRPRIAVGWSGGGDSTALLSLAREWAAARGGEAMALHVDHGLRADSRTEAQALAQRAASHGLSFRRLEWTGTKPATGIMAAAREARLALLEQACVDAGIWHLLLAHHADDQLETATLRAARGSGPDGIAGMSAVVERARMRLVRPLLGFRHADLLATCRARELDWIEDPSNRDPRFARAALRATGQALPERPDTASAAARATREHALAVLLARAVELSGAGFALVDRGVLARAPAQSARTALARVARTIGGGAYAPRGPRTARALDALLQAGASARTLGRCRFVPLRDARLLVSREEADLPEPVALVQGRIVVWDWRFEVRLDAPLAGLSVGPLGREGWDGLPRVVREAAAVRIPPAARPVLPAVRDLDGVGLVPHLMYGRERYPLDTVAIRFRPRHALAGPVFIGP